MKTILVDDEPLAMERFVGVCRSIAEVRIIGQFDDPRHALAYAQRNSVELAVLDIEMPGISGLELAEQLKQIHPNMNIIFVTGYGQYALKAYNLHAAAYLLKPYGEEDVRYALQTAQLLSRRQPPSVIVRTFGSFDVFVKDKPVFFKSSKAKELLAILVDAYGSTVSSEKSIALLWEGKPFDENSQSLYYKAAKSLETTLEEYGIGSILLKTRYARSVNVREFSCDYYLFLQGDETALQSFHGVYMSDYSWAEETLAKLLTKSGDL